MLYQFSQAQSDFSLADNYASNGQFVNGINELQTGQNLITQVNSAEQSYRSSHSSFGGGSSAAHMVVHQTTILIIIILELYCC